MQLTTILAIASAVATASANKFEVVPMALAKRQGGDSFVPGTTPVGSTCPSGTLPCGSQFCTITARGDSCCKEGYACPGGSFCLTQGFCCPNGDDPATCARRNGVTLPPDFNTQPAPQSSASKPASSQSTSLVVSTTSTSSASKAPSSQAPPFPIPSTTSSQVLASGTGALPPASTHTSLFTGGANGHAELGGGVAFALGLLGYLI